MEKHIMGENGISYTLGEDGLYYPDLYLPEETEYPIGKYGMLRRDYLKEHRKGLYLELVLAGKLNEHMHQIDEEFNQMMGRLVEQMKEKQGVTEELKMQDQMAWVGRRMMLETINNMMLELYASMAQAELEKKEKRQREGIEAKKLRGEWDDYGRPSVMKQETFDENFQSVISGKMTPTQLRKSLGMTHSTFYRYRKTFYEKYPELSNT